MTYTKEQRLYQYCDLHELMVEVNYTEPLIFDIQGSELNLGDLCL